MFIYVCKKISNSTKGQTKELKFPIMLILNKNCVGQHVQTDKKPYNITEIFDNRIYDRQHYKHGLSNLRNKSHAFSGKSPENSCIFPPLTDDPNFYPSVTFRELVILGDIFGMHVYHLLTPSFVINKETDNLDFYYFSLKDMGTKLIEDFNEKNKKIIGADGKQLYQLKKVEIKWARNNGQKHDTTHNKYMKYKTKYMLLKKINKLNKIK
jgi:hypothetical protein